MTTPMMEPGPQRPFNGEALVGRLFEQTLGAFELLNVYIGERHGLYQALAADGSATPQQLAGRAGIGPRYAREWLEQQTTAGILQRLAVGPPARAADLGCGEGWLSIGLAAAYPMIRGRWNRCGSGIDRGCPEGCH